MKRTRSETHGYESLSVKGAGLLASADLTWKALSGLTINLGTTFAKKILEAFSCKAFRSPQFPAIGGPSWADILPEVGHQSATHLQNYYMSRLLKITCDGR